MVRRSDAWRRSVFGEAGRKEVLGDDKQGLSYKVGCHFSRF